MSTNKLTEEMNEDWNKSLNIDYLLENKELLNKLYSFFRQYESGDKDKKESLIVEMIDTFSSLMNVKIEKTKVVNNQIGHIAGSYNSAQKQLIVKMVSSTGNYIFSAQIITTILHELRHAYQHQHLMTIDSDFGRLVKYDTENYSQPSDNNKMQDVSYVTNFIEVDAQRFSFNTAKQLTEEVIKNMGDEGRLAKRIIEIKLRDIIAQEKLYESSLAQSMKILENAGNIVNSLKEHFINSCIGFYNNDFESKEEEILNANLISDSMEQFVNLQSNKTVVKPEISDVLDIYLTTLSSVDPAKIVDKLNNSITELFNKMGHNLRYYSSLNKKIGENLISFNGYFLKLKEGVEFGKIFLDKFQISYDEKSNSDIYEKYSENVFDYLAKAMSNSTNNEFDKLLAENVISLELRDPKRFSRNKLIEKIYQNFSEEEIKKILEDSINNDSNVILKTFPIDNILLNGYGSKFTLEKDKKVFSKFLDFYDVKYFKDNFSDILEKFNESFPKFFAECLSKEELSEIEEQFISYAISPSISDNIEIKQYIKEIEQIYSKSKIKSIFSDDKITHHGLDYLISKKVTINDFFKKENPSKDISVELS